MKKNCKRSSLKQKTILTAVVLTCAIALNACGKNKTNENKDPLTGEDMSQTQESSQDDASSGEAGNTDDNTDEFEQLIGNQDSDPNSIISYINTNIVSAGAEDVERFFSGLLSFGDDIRTIDFTGLNDSRQYMPEDMIAFMDLMKLEADTPSMVMSNEENRRVINMTLSEMLERALLFEQHLQKYPNHVTTDAASRLYEEIATNAISGGYNKTEGIAHYYKGESDDVVDQEALRYYQQFAEANPDSNIGRIVQDYISVLQSNQFQINDSMEDFYKGLSQKLRVGNWANSSGNDTSNGINLNNTNGTGTDGNGMNGNGAGGTGTDGNDANGNGADGAGVADTVIEGTVTQ